MILRWIRNNILPSMVIAVIALLGIIVAWNLWQSSLTVKTRAKLQQEQTGAAIESGSDAVNTIGNRQTEDAAGASTVLETQREINNATDAGGVTDAGLGGLCNLRGYRGRPECVRKPAP